MDRTAFFSGVVTLFRSVFLFSLQPLAGTFGCRIIFWIGFNFDGL